MITLAAPISALCAAVLALGQPAASPSVARAACELVAASAEAHGVDPELAVAVAWEESRLSPDAHSLAGAHGVMQASKALREGAIDDIGVGVEELARLLGRHSPARAVTHYNCGRCANPAARAQSERWARAVLRTAARLRAATNDAGERTKSVVSVLRSRVTSLPRVTFSGPPCLEHATTEWAAGRREGRTPTRRFARRSSQGSTR